MTMSKRRLEATTLNPSSLLLPRAGSKMDHAHLTRELAPSIQALTTALHAFMASGSGSGFGLYQQAVLSVPQNPVARIATSVATDRAGRSMGAEAARLKMTELRRLSSPSSP